MFHWALMPRPRHKKGLGDKKTPDENAVKGKYQAKAEFHLSLNKQPCLSVVCIREAERAQRRRVFSCFSFLQRSGGSESGRDRGQQQTEGKKKEEGREQD